jgi:hypothetical protein
MLSGHRTSHKQVVKKTSHPVNCWLIVFGQTLLRLSAQLMLYLFTSKKHKLECLREIKGNSSTIYPVTHDNIVNIFTKKPYFYETIGFYVILL